MINEKKLIAKFQRWIEEGNPHTGLKQEALLRKVIAAIREEADYQQKNPYGDIYEEIKQRIEEANNTEAAVREWTEVKR